MFQRGWDLFGIPHHITSDQGTQFISQWWKTLCSLLGIQQTYSHAYMHRGNGRAEQAIKSIQQNLRRIHAQKSTNWVEALPEAIRVHNDKPTIGGLSPHQILFGRDRSLGGIPLSTPSVCEDAQTFIQRKKELEKQILDTSNKEHMRLMEYYNAKRKRFETHQLGDKVWLMRPKRTGDKLETYWVGPCLIIQRTGQHSYEVDIGEGKTRTAHIDQMKKYEQDENTGQSLKIHYYPYKHGDFETDLDGMEVADILQHKTEHGQLKFLTLWEGYPRSEATWEPVNHFFHRYCYKLVEYAKNHNLQVDVLPYLSDKAKS